MQNEKILRKPLTKKKKNALKDGIVPVFCPSAPAIFLGFWPTRGLAG